MDFTKSVPELLVLGHVTRDELDGGGARLGGAASYAASAAAVLGVETALCTVAPPDDPLLAPLVTTPRLRVHCAPAEAMTTFALGYAGGRRSLALARRARSLAPDDVPAAWRDAPVAYVGPVAGECDRALVESLRSRFVGAGLQGWLRRAGAAAAWSGPIEPALAPEALAPPPVQLAVLSELDHPDAGAIAARFAAAGAVVAITRGARGATLLPPGAGARPVEIAPYPAREVDPTGAGDVFGVVLALELARGASLADAGAAAARAAARVVEGPGLGALSAVGV
jgi:sugar/nucleoside kinase (ribokinase family)